ncbi:MAG: hypothetical protein AAGB11_05775 [Pseudomonadota bacterium]
MTIGIAVSGRCAGLAAFSALRAVEAVGRGAIGGFASFVAISLDGEIIRAQTQRGGARTLFTAGETTGVMPPTAFAEAPLAALMSSGPDRPLPLSQFTPAKADVGLVSGHRLPNLALPSGCPLNEEVLALMSRGASPETAVALLNDFPKADAGVIAVALDGSMALANTALVERRDDIGSAFHKDRPSGLTVGVLHNAIFPAGALAALAVAAAVDAVAPADRSDFEIAVEAGLALQLGEHPQVDVCGRAVTAITVDEAAWLGKRWEGTAITRSAPVIENGETIGWTVSEPYCVAQEGRLVSMSGSTKIHLGVREA